MTDNEARHILFDRVSSSSSEDQQGGVSTVFIASYDLRALEQTGSGQFNAVAAYDTVTDAMLVLGTEMFKYEANWVPVTMLVERTKRIGDIYGRTRGF